MKKISIVLILLMATLLMVTFSFAQTPREGKSSEGKTTFTNIAAVGLSKDGTNARTKAGVPGYIEMVNTAGNTFYLYIGYDGKLRISSDIAVGWGASPSTVTWIDASGVVVGSQLKP